MERAKTKQSSADALGYVWEIRKDSKTESFSVKDRELKVTVSRPASDVDFENACFRYSVRLSYGECTLAGMTTCGGQDAALVLALFMFGVAHKVEMENPYFAPEQIGQQVKLWIERNADVILGPVHQEGCHSGSNHK